MFYIFSRFETNLELLSRFLQKFAISNFTAMRPVVAALIHADGRVEANRRDYANSPKNVRNTLEFKERSLTQYSVGNFSVCFRVSGALKCVSNCYVTACLICPGTAIV
jgi:hypothetical protein